MHTHGFCNLAQPNPPSDMALTHAKRCYFLVQPDSPPALVPMLIGGNYSLAGAFLSAGPSTCQWVLQSHLTCLVPSPSTCQLVLQPSSAALHPYWLLCTSVSIPSQPILAHPQTSSLPVPGLMLTSGSKGQQGSPQSSTTKPTPSPGSCIC